MRTLLIYLSLLPLGLAAQEYGLMPLTGLTYHQQGISFKEFEIELDGSTWTSNRLPINTQFSIKMIEPTGFVLEEDNCYPGIEVTILNTKGDTLGYSANIFGTEPNPMSAAMLSNLSLLLNFNEMSKVGDTNILIARFFDQKSKRSTSIHFPMIIVEPQKKLWQGNMMYGSSSWEGYQAKGAFVELSAMEVRMDSMYLPAKLMHTMRLVKVGNLTQEEFKKGKLEVYIYDRKMKRIPFTGELKHFVVKNTDEPDKLNLLYKVPMDPNDPEVLNYTVRVRWEEETSGKVLEALNKFGKR